MPPAPVGPPVVSVVTLEVAVLGPPGSACRTLLQAPRYVDRARSAAPRPTHQKTRSEFDPEVDMGDASCERARAARRCSFTGLTTMRLLCTSVFVLISSYLQSAPLDSIAAPRSLAELPLYIVACEKRDDWIVRSFMPQGASCPFAPSKTAVFISK